MPADLKRHRLGSSLRSPAEGEGHEGFPPPPDKDGAPRDSAGSGATEEGLTSRGGRHLRLPLRFGLRQDAALEGDGPLTAEARGPLRIETPTSARENKLC